MRSTNAFVLAAALVLPAVLGGCLSVQAAKDYWNNVGTVVVKLGTLPPERPDGLYRGQVLQTFSEFKIAVKGVIVEAPNEIQSIAAITFAPNPVGVDLLQRQKENAGLQILEKRMAPKTVSAVSVSILLFKATKDGKDVPACPSKSTSGRPTPSSTPAEHPCIALPPAGLFKLDKAADPPAMKRGRTLTLNFPLAVIYDAKVDEYFLQSRSAKEEAPVTIS